jgi:hypothetical protein
MTAFQLLIRVEAVLLAGNFREYPAMILLRTALTVTPPRMSLLLSYRLMPKLPNHSTMDPLSAIKFYYL